MAENIQTIHTRRIALAAFALHNGGELIKYERGEYFVNSPWSISELTRNYNVSKERRFDNHIIRLRDIKRGSRT